MKKKWIFLKKLIGLILLVLFICALVKEVFISNTYDEAISKVIDSKYSEVFQIEEMMVDQQINENQFFVLYKNYNKKLCAGVFDKNVFGFKRNSLSIGTDSYDLDKDKNETTDIEACCSPYEGGTFYYGKIVNNLVDKVFAGEYEATIITYEDVKYFYYVHDIDFGDHLDFSCTYK